MPSAEKNPLPKGQPYGQRKAQEQAMSEAPPPEPQPQDQQVVPQQANVHVPEPTDTRNLPQPDQQVVPGAALNPEDAQVLFAPQSNQVVAQDAQHLEQWLPVLQEIAAQPGASEGMRNLADSVSRWFAAQK